MKKSFGRWLPATLAALVLASFALTPYADAAGRGGGGGGGGGGGRGGQAAVAPGTYSVKLTVDGRSYSQPLTVKPDPREGSR